LPANKRSAIAALDQTEAPIKWIGYVLAIPAALLFICAIAIAGISTYAAGIIVRPAIKEVPPIKVNLAVDYTSVNFKSINGVSTLRGWHFKAPSSENIVIMVHGTGENRFQFGTDTLEIVETLIARNFSVLAFDLQNSGDAAPGISTFGLHEKDDVLGAINYARGLRYENIVVYGFATGANAAVLACSKPKAEKISNPVVTQHLLDTLSNSVKALILDTPITDIGDYLMHGLTDMGFELPEFPFRITIPIAVNLLINGDINEVSDEKTVYDFIPRPILLLHGDKDEVVPSAGAMEIYVKYLDKAIGKVSMWNDPKAGHLESFNVSRDEYLEKLTDFLEMVFPEDTSE